MPKHRIKLVQKFEQIVEIDCPGDHLDACVLVSKRVAAKELKFNAEKADPVGNATVEPTYGDTFHEES